ncbi:alpha/beta hydrolase [Rhodococcus sp. 7Tela_A2]|uniref:alpha/beta hydrolase n=1 Tax=Rhodococcus sp. 7Tela_A2 TaxID=3093744 RepID=UPI003BB815CF
MHVLRLMSLAVVAGLAVLGCSAPGNSTQPPSDVAVPGELEKFYRQAVRWESCAGYGADGRYLALNGVECARITVPLDYDDPDEQTVSLALSRSRAGGDRIGSLLTNPGGPGASGLSLALAGEGTPLAEHFDVIGMDPRGIGASDPQIVCRTDAETDADRALDPGDTTSEGIARAEKLNREYADLCAERTGPEVLAHVGTREVVRDMDVVRGVLGDDQLTYLGYSYGTRLGAEYAAAFPDRVRAMVLDGAIDPDQDPVEEIVLQAEGFQRAFEEFARYCADYDGCPLGDDPAAAVDRFRALVGPLLDTPAPTTDPRGLSYGDAITGVQQGLYSPTLWGSLRGGLDSLASSGTGDTLLRLADLYEGRGDDGTYSNITAAFDAVRCVDDVPVTDRVLAGELDTRFREAAPFLDDGRGNGSAALDTCAFWRVPPTVDGEDADLSGLAPVLVVSTTADPATPYLAGVELAGHLGGALLSFDGTQHTVVLDGEKCVDDAVTRYLIDLEVPETDPHC